MSRGKQLKQNGINQVVVNNALWVQKMRTKAISIAKRKGEVCVDDLRKHAVKLEEKNITASHSNVWGGIFRTPDFQYIYHKQSEVESNHARSISVYCLAGSV